MITKTNDDFYSDVVEKKVVLRLEPSLQYSGSKIRESLSALTDDIAEAEHELSASSVKDVFGTISWIDLGASSEIVVRLTGTKPWDKSKIAEYKKAVGEEKDEIKTLKELMEKHPQKAFELFSKIVSQKLDGE